MNFLIKNSYNVNIASFTHKKIIFDYFLRYLHYNFNLVRIILLGYMGSGKTTIGKTLSKKMNLPFYDLDRYIEAEEEKTIATIFKDKGEIYFRKMEHKYLKEFMQLSNEYVLSLGGGTPCYSGNMEFIMNQKDVKLVYLKASAPTLRQRISKNQQQRPLVAPLSDEKMTEFIAKHLFERGQFYEKARYTVITDQKDVVSIVAEIKVLLQ